jgi:phytoene dehydrogenase-like protein
MGNRLMIIIGAGIAGLATGCYAQMNGYDSRIFESNSKPGGLAAAWRRRDYLIDGGIHFLIGHREGNPIHDVYREIGTADPDSTVDMDTYLRFSNETGTRVLDFTSDLDRLEQDMIEISPVDEEEIRGVIKEVRWMRDSPMLSDLGMSAVPPELKGRLDSLKEMWQMRSFMKYFVGKYSKSARAFARTLKSPFLRTAFENLFGPTAPFWFVIMILASVSAGMLGLLKGGCPGFIDPIVKRYEEIRGKVSYRSHVTRVLVEDDTAVGVELADGTQHRADVVVSAADGYSTIFDLLDGRFVDEKTRERYETWKRYDPAVMISLGVNRTFESLPPLSMYMMEEPVKVGGRNITCLPLRTFNYSNEFAPPGKTVMQIMFETEWELWSGLRSDRNGYDAQKERIAEEFISRLDDVFDGVSEDIEVVDVATPYTTWRYTHNHQGSPMGWLMTKDSLMTQIPRTLPGLKNFYMAGQWVLPGGGVPACVYTGRNVIQILCKKEGREFVTSSASS